ncbi:MAG: GntR family transcriptional regulator [Candidatus Saccharimonadales bacterium]
MQRRRNWGTRPARTIPTAGTKLKIERVDMSMDIDICARIREDIISGTLGFGTRVTMAGLAERYGVSQMPVRVALSQLQGEGLVETTASGRASIRSVDRKFVNSIFDIRRSLEALVIQGAAEQINLDQLAALEQIETELEGMVERADYAGAHKANRIFHQIIADAANNKDAVALLDRHWFLVSALWHRVGYGPERFAGVVTDHQFLIKSLRLRDAGAAVMIVHAHITKAKLVMLDQFPEPDVTPTPGRRRSKLSKIDV